MLDTNVTRREIAALDERRERLLQLPARILAMPMTHAVAHADGNGDPLAKRFDTVGEMLARGSREHLTMPYVGKKKLSRLYATLEAMMPKPAGPAAAGFPSPEASSPAQKDAGEDPRESIRRTEDTPTIRREVARLVQIEDALADTPAPDGGTRSPAAIMTQALAIYARMGSMDFRGGIEEALENHASALRS
jgi:hypothetical protein